MEITRAGVLLIDDHPIFREGLRRIVEAEEHLRVVGETDSVEGAVEQARALRPELILLDLGLKDGSGLEALPRLREVCPQARVIVLTGYGPESVQPALEAGARGYVSKDTAADHLLGAIGAVLRGEIWDEAVAAGPSLPDFSPPAGLGLGGIRLTPREREVLGLVGQGRRNSEIARALHISENTVKTHIASLMRKLEINDRLQLTAAAARAAEAAD